MQQHEFVLSMMDMIKIFMPQHVDMEWRGAEVWVDWRDTLERQGGRYLANKEEIRRTHSIQLYKYITIVGSYVGPS
mgnify:CR=1 FL=1